MEYIPFSICEEVIVPEQHQFYENLLNNDIDMLRPVQNEVLNFVNSSSSLKIIIHPESNGKTFSLITSISHFVDIRNIKPQILYLSSFDEKIPEIKKKLREYFNISSQITFYTPLTIDECKNIEQYKFFFIDDCQRTILGYHNWSKFVPFMNSRVKTLFITSELTENLFNFFNDKFHAQEIFVEKLPFSKKTYYTTDIIPNDEILCQLANKNIFQTNPIQSTIYEFLSGKLKYLTKNLICINNNENEIKMSLLLSIISFLHPIPNQTTNLLIILNTQEELDNYYKFLKSYLNIDIFILNKEINKEFKSSIILTFSSIFLKSYIFKNQESIPIIFIPNYIEDSNMKTFISYFNNKNNSHIILFNNELTYYLENIFPNKLIFN